MSEMIRDMTGRLIGIHDKPGWKVSAFERDELYQQYKEKRLATQPRDLFLRWASETAERYGLSPKRVLDIVFEGDGNRGKKMQWWVGCSTR
jgi:hypothetical protein